jgi:hypothetical protein
MVNATIDRINQLASERSRLYRQAGSARRDTSVRERIAEITNELQTLWEARRHERAGRRDGIDLLVDLEYERIYGSGYEEVVRPSPVADEEHVVAVVAA